MFGRSRKEVDPAESALIPTSSPGFELDCFGVTDPGVVRDRNEDQFLVADLHKSLSIRHTSLPEKPGWRVGGGTYASLLMVADGMGGMGHGDTASRLVVDTLMRYAIQALDWLDVEEKIDADEIAADLAAGVRRCKKRLDRESLRDPTMTGMGSTLTLAYVIGATLIVLHLGDCRCYIIRDGRMEKITGDHTMAQQMVERGLVKPEEVEGSRLNHILWNAIGTSDDVDLRPDVIERNLKLGDVVVLCSDGLNKHVEDDEIRDLVLTDPDPGTACKKLIETAKGRGGTDNITVVMARCVPENPDSDPTP